MSPPAPLPSPGGSGETSLPAMAAPAGDNRGGGSVENESVPAWRIPSGSFAFAAAAAAAAAAACCCCAGVVRRDIAAACAFAAAAAAAASIASMASPTASAVTGAPAAAAAPAAQTNEAWCRKQRSMGGIGLMSACWCDVNEVLCVDTRWGDTLGIC
jgi:hypothetical protein